MKAAKALMMGLGASGGAVPGGGLYVDDVFSAYTYTGNGSSQTITNGIDLAGHGGMVWGKLRSQSYSHWLVDSARGIGLNGTYKYLSSDLTNTEFDVAARSLSSFNSNGFTLANGNNSQFNNPIYNYVSWTFRNAPKFFDVVTYTGNSSNRMIPHNLGVAPGMVIVKQTNSSNPWMVWHKSLSTGNIMRLQDTAGAWPVPGGFPSTHTDTQFSVGNYDPVNTTGNTYVAYLFAHDPEV